MDTVFRNANVLDVRRGEIIENQTVLIQDGLIKDLGAFEPPVARETIDLGGRTLMPGLIDCHVHATQTSGDFAELRSWEPSYLAFRAAEELKAMLGRGFTTVRDMGGADSGLARAVREGLIQGPRLKFGGPILAPTGGHVLTRICDGPTELRRAIREQMAKGADHVKLTLSGGVVSTMAITALAFTEEEIRAAVEETSFADSYVAGHAYTARTVNRALRCGVRTIEHGSMIDESSIELFLQYDAFLVPTLATFQALHASGAEHLSAASRSKLQHALDASLASLELATTAGVSMGYGTDLHGELHNWQLEEFLLRAQVQKPVDIIRAATVVGAQIVNMPGKIGEVTPGAYADLLVVDGNPLDDVAVLTSPETKLPLIMMAGRLVKNNLPPSPSEARST